MIKSLVLLYFLLHHFSTIYIYLVVSVYLSLAPCDILLSRFTLQNIEWVENVQQIYVFDCWSCGRGICHNN